MNTRLLAALAICLSGTVSALGQNPQSTAGPERLPSEAAAGLPGGFRLPRPTMEHFLSRDWHYYYTIDKPAVSASAASDLAEKTVAFREQVDKGAVAFLVREEQGLRKLAKEGGAPRFHQSQARQCYTSPSGDLFECVDVDGGYSGSVNGAGLTLQTLMVGTDVFHRCDSADQGVSATFQVEPRDDQHSWQNSILVDEWLTHLGVIEYCQEQGTSNIRGVVQVAKDVLLGRPPLGVSYPFTGTRFVMQAKRLAAKLCIYVTVFDQSGKPRQEWESEWLDSQPIRLRTKTWWSTGSKVQQSREFVVTNESALGRAPGLPEMVALPFESRTLSDFRGDMGGDIIDPLGDGLATARRPWRKEQVDPPRAPDKGTGIVGMSGFDTETVMPLPLPWEMAFKAGDKGVRASKVALINGSSSVVTVKKLMATCPCVQFPAQAYSVPPFQSVDIEFSIDLPELEKVTIEIWWEANGKEGKSEVLIIKEPKTS